MSAAKTFLVASLFLCCAGAFAQTDEKDPAAIVELGGASAWDLGGRSASGGPDVAIEVTPIEKWLELEAGVTPLFNRHSTEWGVDLLFKKPWTLSKKVEFMAGVGPEWIRSKQNGVAKNAFAGEAVLDFMFWPGGKHRFGWFVEPSYEYSFGHEHERSFGISAGLLIAIR